MPWIEAQALGTLGDVHRLEGDVEGAWDLERKSARIAADSGFRWWQAGSLAQLLELGLMLGRLDEAAEFGRDALRLAVAMADLRITLWVLTGLARIDCARGHLERAGRLWGAVTVEVERERLSSSSFEEFAQPLATVADPRLHAAEEQGKAEGLEAAIALALGEDQTWP